MKLNFFACFLLILLINVRQCLASKILVLFPTISPSHLVITEALTRELADRGHEIVIFSIFHRNNEVKNHRYYIVNTTKTFNDELESFMSGVQVQRSPLNMLQNIHKMMYLTFEAGKSTLADDRLKELMETETFDLVILNFFHNNFLLGVAEHFRCPTIMISAAELMSSTNFLMGNPLSIETVPHNFLINDGTMNLWKRLLNFLLYSGDLMVNLWIDIQQKKIYENNFKYPSYQEAKKNVSLLLVNQYSNQPLVSSVIEVGGFHVGATIDPLPEEIQKWIDEAEHGVIYFSLGSNVKSKYLKDTTLRHLLSAFSKLRQKVIFKWESSQLPDKPENVMTGKWFPQKDILANPKVKLFISHCGLASVTEAKYHAVPILAIPIFGDQFRNAQQIVSEGWGLELSLDVLTADLVVKSVNKIMNDQWENVQQLSQLYKDRPMSALETAVYWTEYVIRHKGAKNLRYQGANLNFIQYNLLDVLGIIILIFYFLNKIVGIILT